VRRPHTTPRRRHDAHGTDECGARVHRLSGGDAGAPADPGRLALHVRIVNPYWTSAGYLAESKWWFSGWFHDIAANPTLLTIVDYVNEWGLLVIGIGLMFGLFTRTVTVAAMVLLFLYYIAAPPFVGYVYSMPSEGSYLIVNKVLIELVAVAVLLAFPTGRTYGLDRFIGRGRARPHQPEA